ncbi:hypothetical protein IKP85_07640 [bacterium]|nr:hypothetical protein [bacterium]
MKILPVGQFNSYIKANSSYQSNKISFGFGQDYGDDDYLIANDYEHKEGGNVFTYFSLLGQFFYRLIKEHFFNDYSMSAKNYDDADDIQAPTESEPGDFDEEDFH